jgi:hypothetical protein
LAKPGLQTPNGFGSPLPYLKAMIIRNFLTFKKKNNFTIIQSNASKKLDESSAHEKDATGVGNETFQKLKNYKKKKKKKFFFFWKFNFWQEQERKKKKLLKKIFLKISF